MSNSTNATNMEAPAMICPICNKEFFDVHSFAKHLTEHSEKEKKRKEEEEKKAREEKRKIEYDNIVKLFSEKKSIDKKIESAIADYKKNYGSFSYSYSESNNDDLESQLKRILSSLWF